MLNTKLFLPIRKLLKGSFSSNFVINTESRCQRRTVELLRLQLMTLLQRGEGTDDILRMFRKDLIFSVQTKFSFA